MEQFIKRGSIEVERVWEGNSEFSFEQVETEGQKTIPVKSVVAFLFQELRRCTSASDRVWEVLSSRCKSGHESEGDGLGRMRRGL